MGKHIAFFNIPAMGHIFPTLAVVEELVRRGHRVTYTSIERRRPLLEAAGATVHSYRSLRPSDFDPALRVPPRHGYLSQTLLSFLDEAEAAFLQLEPAYRDDRPDLIVFDRMAFAGRVLSAKLDVPMVQLWPMLVSNEHWSMGQALGAFDPADPVFLKYLSKLEAFLAMHCPGLDPAVFLSPEPRRHLAFYPRRFQYSGELFGPSYTFAGPCLRRAPGKWRPSGDAPVLLVTLGTIYNANLDFYRCCASALADGPWHVVMAVGERVRPDELGALPANVEAHCVVPQLDVLPHCAALVSHAGVGGVMEAMSYGVPVLAAPQTLEQEANAARIEQLGIGARLPSDGFDPDTLRAAIELMVKDPGVADGVARMRRAVETAGGTTRAADAIEECLR